MNIRNAHYFDEIFGCDMLFSIANMREHIGDKYDVIFVGYSTRYSAYKQEVEFLDAHKNSVLIYVSTEYGNQLPACLSITKRQFVLLANYESLPKHMESWTGLKKHLFANINVLTYDDEKRSAKKTFDVIYYGQFRPDRAEYLISANWKNVTFSTSKKNVREWASVGVFGFKWIDPLNWENGYETLAQYRKSLYFEDRYTHTNYNCLANRFYEAIKCDVLPMIHSSCEGTILRSGYHVPTELIWSSFSEMDKVRYSSGLLQLLRVQASSEKARVQNEIVNLIGGL